MLIEAEIWVFLNKGTKTLIDYQPLSLMPVSLSDRFF